MQTKETNSEPEATTAMTVPPAAAAWWPRWAAIGALIVLLGCAYLTTLLPSVDRGDAAEIQYMSAVLGLCHAPGYQTEIVLGKLFSLLPIGTDIAWRINLMMAVAGVIGCLALFGAVRRITGRMAPAFIAATILGFSSTYWSFCVVAEAYVFYGMFLLLGVYTTVRFVSSDRAIWLYLTALALGICVAGRPSELFVLPGFLAVWLGFRQRLRASVVRIAAAAVVFVLPFGFSVAYTLLRDKPAYLHARDDAFYRQTMGRSPTLIAGTGFERVKNAAYFCLGLEWTDEGEFSTDSLQEGVARYARQLSGVAVLTDRVPPTEGAERNTGAFGTGISAIGLLLALAGGVFWRRDYGWVLLGLLLFAGNLAFCLWHHRWDGLTFTTPGLVGLALLAGLGAAGPKSHTGTSRWRLPLALVGAVAAVVLLVFNYRLVDRSTPVADERQALCQAIANAPWPRDSAIISLYWEATNYRYLLHIQAERTDVQVFNVRTADFRDVAARCEEQGLATFLSPRYCMKLNPQRLDALLRRTPPRFYNLGLVRLPPPRQPRQRRP